MLQILQLRRRYSFYRSFSQNQACARVSYATLRFPAFLYSRDLASSQATQQADTLIHVRTLHQLHAFAAWLGTQSKETAPVPTFTIFKIIRSQQIRQLYVKLMQRRIYDEQLTKVFCLIA